MERKLTKRKKHGNILLCCTYTVLKSRKKYKKLIIDCKTI